MTSPLSMPKVRPDHRPTRYSLSPHAGRQAALKGYSPEAVLEAANDPSCTYPSGRFPGQERHTRGGLVAICDPSTMLVVTVYADVVETPLRPDQKEAR
jgi:hypothetical protein